MKSCTNPGFVSGYYCLVGAAIALLITGLIARERFVLTIALGESMLPGIKSGQLLLVDKRFYQTALPKRGDIVVARYRGDLVVKRVVGLPGEEIELKQGTLFVDGVAQHENYTIQPGSLDVGKGRLMDGDFATLGDNRAIPAAIAVHPIVTRPEILGKVVAAFGRQR